MRQGSSMPARLRSLLLKTPVLIGLGLLGAWLLFAWLAFEPLVRWAAPKYVAERSGHVLRIGSASLHPFALSVRLGDVALDEPDGAPLLAFEELLVDFDSTGVLRGAWGFDAIDLTGPRAWLALRADGRLNWSALVDAFRNPEPPTDDSLPRLLIRQLRLAGGRVDLVDHRVGFETALDPLDLNLSDLSTLPDDVGAYAIEATTEPGARIRWQGDLTLNPVAAKGRVAIDRVALDRLWPYLRARLRMAPPKGVAALSLNYRAGYADREFSLNLDDIGFELAELELRGVEAPTPAVALDRITLAGGRFDLGERRLDLGEINLGGGQLRLKRETDGRLDIGDWFAGAPPADPATTPPEAPAPMTVAASPTTGTVPAWRLNLERLALDGIGLRVEDAGFAKPLVLELGNLRLGLAAHAELGGARMLARVEDIGIDLSGLRLLAEAGSAPLFVLGGLAVTGGMIDLGERAASFDQIGLVNGKLELTRAADGRIPLLAALTRVGATSVAPPAPSDAGTAPAWRYRIGHLGLSGFEIGARDESVRPAGGLTLERIELGIDGISDDPEAPLPTRLSATIREGGSLRVEGKLTPAAPAADLRLKLERLALAPAQPWLSQAANLRFASGHAGLHGRLRYDGGAARARQLDFRGGFSVTDLLLNETESGERFLAWRMLASDSARASLDHLAIAELRLDQLGAKLVIQADKTVNLKNILKTPESPPVDMVVTPAATPAAPAGAPPPAFRLDIDRVRVERGELDFADLSLALPFGTRVHDFTATLNGISTRTGQRAELELDGRVDDHGMARAVGQFDLFDPTDFMDIKAVFRNVEMNRLTPYTATFAGYKIASGKLSLDLEYKIQQRQLLGENQIVMDRLTLGERLEGPDIKHLPLELAIAILRDSNGVIDLGLPVSGSLDDPQFSYGRIIWKAIGNILTKLVTAPFRALGALFGGDGEKLEKIVFEPGEAGLTPPEKEKFGAIGQILNKRPGLALTVHGVWSAERDRPAMRETRLRRAIAEAMGLRLAADEEPGPISTANPKARAALESLYAQRFGARDWETLSAKWRQANPDPAKKAEEGRLMSRLKNLLVREQPPPPLSGDELAELAGADLHDLLYRRLFEREQVGDADLQALAGRRAQAIVSGLIAAGAPAARVRAGAIEAHAGDGADIPARLELGVAATPTESAVGPNADTSKARD